MHDNEYVSLVKVTSLNSKWTYDGAFQRKKPPFENRPKAPKWEVAESILLPALYFTLMLLSLTKYKAPQIYLNFSSVRNKYLCRGDRRANCVQNVVLCSNQFTVNGLSPIRFYYFEEAPLNNRPSLDTSNIYFSRK